jgi:hypothetical protein
VRKDGHIALRKAASRPGGDIPTLANGDVRISGANCGARVNLFLPTGTLRSPETNGTVQVLKVERNPFKEIDCG